MNQQTTRAQSATEILRTAGQTLGERGKQYDPNGKQERSMTAIVAAFNAIYHRNPLTVHMGWQFMSLVKMVRGATKPHADSALDQVAYAALAAESVAEQLHQPAPTPAEQHAAEPIKYYVVLSQPELYDVQKEFIMEQVLAGHKVQIMSDKTARRLHLEEELEEEPKSAHTENATQFFGQVTTAEPMPYVDPMIGGQTDYERWQGAEAALRSMRTSRDVWKRDYGTIHKKLVEVEAVHMELANQVHKERDMTAKFQAERKANVAMHEEVTRLRGKVQELADLAEYRDKRNAELCAELESQRGKCIAQSSRISELQTLVDNLRSSLAQATKEAPCAHNTDEPKAPRPEYVDPFDQYGDMRSPMHRLVGGLDPARGGLAYPQGKDAPTPL